MGLLPSPMRFSKSTLTAPILANAASPDHNSPTLCEGKQDCTHVDHNQLDTLLIICTNIVLVLKSTKCICGHKYVYEYIW